MEASALNARINLLEMDAGQLAQISPIKSYLEEFKPHGDIRGSGTICAEWDSLAENMKVQSSLNLSLKAWGFKGFLVQDTENVSCHYDSEKSFTVQQCKSALVTPADGRIQGLMTLDKGEYHFPKKEVNIEGLHFNAPAENLGYIAKNLAEGFPTVISSSTVEAIHHLKWIGNVKGTLHLNILPDNHYFKLSLQEGNYYFAKKNHEVNNFSLTLDKEGFRVITQYRYQQVLFWLMAESLFPHFGTGADTDFKPSSRPMR